MKRNNDLYYYNTANLVNDISTRIAIEKQVITHKLESQLQNQNSKPKLFEKKPIYHSHFSNQISSSGLRIYNSSQHQSSSNIQNLSQNVSHSPIQEPSKTLKQNKLSRPPSSKQSNQKDSHVAKLSQQKLSSILCFMTSKPDYKKIKVDIERRKSGAEMEGSELETTKFLRKNQSMSDLPLTLSKTPNPSPLVINQIQKSPFISTTQKLKRTSQKNINIDKIKMKIKKLFSEREQSSNEQQLNDFNIKFNCLMLQMAQLILNDQPPSSQDQISSLHLDHAFKQQIQALQQFQSLKNERSNLEQQLNIQLKKVEMLMKDNNRLNKETQDLKRDKDLLLKDLQKQIIEKENLSGEIKKLKIQIEKLENTKQKPKIEQLNQPEKQGTIVLKNILDEINDERNELKYLIQGQFEAIQKLLQREQLVKVFLKKVGDSSILVMFEKFIQEAESADPNDTEGNVHAQVSRNQNEKLDQFHEDFDDKIHNQEVIDFGNSLLKQYEKSYRLLNLCDSQLADDSRVNDSEESSFRYLGKEEATEISQWIETAPELKDQSNKKKKIILPKSLKEKLKINIKDLAICQLNQLEYMEPKPKPKTKQFQDSPDSFSKID